MKSMITSRVIRALRLRGREAVCGRDTPLLIAAVTRLLLSGCGLLLSGCGTGAYDELMTQRLAELNRMGPFVALHGAQTLEGTRVKIRVPQVFKASYTELSSHPQDGPKIFAQRVQPPFMRLPGFRLCFEASELDAQNFRLPCYCYLAAIPVKPGLTLAAPIAAKLKQEFPAANAAWEPAAVRSPAGTEVAWQKIRVEGEQLFNVKRPSQPQPEFMKFPGIFELWMYESVDYIVLIGWRVPASLEEKVHLLDLAPITAGTIVIDPPPAEAGAAPPA